MLASGETVAAAVPMACSVDELVAAAAPVGIQVPDSASRTPEQSVIIVVGLYLSDRG